MLPVSVSLFLKLTNDAVTWATQRGLRRRSLDREGSAGGRQNKAERGSDIFFALHPNPAAHRAHKVLDDEQAEPGAGNFRRGRIVRSEEFGEQLGLICFRDSHSGINNIDLNEFVCRPCRDRYGRKFRGVLERVAQEVGDDLRKLVNRVTSNL